MKILKNLFPKKSMATKPLESGMVANPALKKSPEIDMRAKWSMEGIELLQSILQSDLELEEMAYRLIGKLVRHSEAIQGGLFLAKTEDEEQMLELIACYAYERKKRQETVIFAGDGPLGKCLVSREAVFLTSIDATYLEITSGLGAAAPDCLVVLPLVYNEQMLGAIELAAFKVFDGFELEFLQSASVLIAKGLDKLIKYREEMELLQDAKALEKTLRSLQEEIRQNIGKTKEEVFKMKQDNVSSAMANC